MRLVVGHTASTWVQLRLSINGESMLVVPVRQAKLKEPPAVHTPLHSQGGRANKAALKQDRLRIRPTTEEIQGLAMPLAEFGLRSPVSIVFITKRALQICPHPPLPPRLQVLANHGRPFGLPLFLNSQNAACFAKGFSAWLAGSISCRPTLVITLDGLDSLFTHWLVFSLNMRIKAFPCADLRT
jgi:hypothetical protein